jgi:SpoVK/Ycf46/Vps4 family AAA+-type ATPase
MQSSDDSIQALREALRLSPANVPLRKHLGDMLLNSGRPGEAEKEYRQALSFTPDDRQLKTNLADSFFQQEKYSQSLVLIEDLLKGTETPARAYLIHARLLLRSGEVERAVRQYCEAVELDPATEDKELAHRLGLADQGPGEIHQGKLRQAHAMPEMPPDGNIERPTLTFADVGGMEALKDEIRLKIIYPLAHPELYQAYGKAIGGGILLYGPPGCGKTHLARATAGEVNAGFLAVGINEILEMWIGQSERNLHAIFEQARANKPCVLFFDEVDALGASRSDLRHGGARQLINQFLSELDGIKDSNDGVLILAATNAPWHLDNAFRRPGRFDRILFVPPPDAPARAAVLRIHCAGKPAAAIDFEKLSGKTEGFSGADLRAVVELAIENKLREAVQLRGIPQPLSTQDLLAAAANLRPSTREWFATAKNYALFSNQGGLYDDILKYLKM